MPIVIINPNSTQSMTEAMVAQAQRAAPSLTFEGWTSNDGPASIQGPQDGAAARAPFLALVTKAVAAGVDGIIIGCFDDTALEEAAALAPCPVIGIGQASYHYAALRNWRFSVVTTLSVSVPVLEENIARLGLSGFRSKVRASEVPVLALEANATLATQSIKEEALSAEQEDGIDAVILGCAGMVQVASDIEETLSIQVIDPVVCAAKSMMWLSA